METVRRCKQHNVTISNPNTQNPCDIQASAAADIRSSIVGCYVAYVGVIGRRFGTIYWSHLQRSSWTVWPLKIGRMVYPKTSVNNKMRCVTTQKSKDLILRLRKQNSINKSCSLFQLTPPGEASSFQQYLEIYIIIIIIIINCNWVIIRWQWLFYMYTKVILHVHKGYFTCTQKLLHHRRKKRISGNTSNLLKSTLGNADSPPGYVRPHVHLSTDHFSFIYTLVIIFLSNIQRRQLFWRF
jgi:hypothetical protein